MSTLSKEQHDADRQRGLYNKYDVKRLDGSSEAGKKHEGCEYFVLDLTHDPFALIAARAYAAACEATYPLLAADLAARLDEADAQGFSWTDTDGLRR